MAAKVAVKVVVVLGLAEGIGLGILLISLRNVWGFLFTNELQVVEYLSAIMPILAISNFMDAIQGVLSGTSLLYIDILVLVCNRYKCIVWVVSGTARGCGWQKIGAWVNLGAYYLLGLPSAITFTFVLHFGGKVLLILFNFF